MQDNICNVNKDDNYPVAQTQSNVHVVLYGAVNTVSNFLERLAINLRNKMLLMVLIDQLKCFQSFILSNTTIEMQQS